MNVAVPIPLTNNAMSRNSSRYARYKHINENNNRTKAQRAIGISTLNTHLMHFNNYIICRIYYMFFTYVLFFSRNTLRTSSTVIALLVLVLTIPAAIAAPAKCSATALKTCEAVETRAPNHVHGPSLNRCQTSLCTPIGSEISVAAQSHVDSGKPEACVAGGYNTKNVLFTDPWEQGITGGAGLWRGLHDGGILRRATSPVRHGRYAAEVIVRPGDKYKNIAQERTEVLNPQAISDGHIITTHEGETQYIAFSVKMPKDWEKPIHYVILWQIHAPGKVKRSPIEFHATDRFFLRTNHYVPYTPDGRRIGHRIDFTDGGLNRGDWTDIVIKLTTGISDKGGVTVWRRNEDDTSFQQVVHQSGLNLHPGYHKHGMYRGADPERTYRVWLDGFTIATTFDDAVLAAFGDCAKVD